MGMASTLEDVLQRQLDKYVTGASASVASILAPIAVTGLTIYFVMMAFAVVRGEIESPLNKIQKDLLKIAVIVSLAIGAGSYQSYVIRFANGLAADLSSAVSSGAAKSPGKAIDKANEGCVTVGSDCVPYDVVLLKKSREKENAFGLPGIDFMFAFVLTAIAQFIISILCILPSLLSQIGLAMMLALGPVFILCLLWPVTSKYFESWLSATLGFVFTKVLVVAICTVIPTIYREYLLEAMKGVAAEANVVSDALMLLFVAAALGISALHASQKGAQLAGGGVSMDSKGLGGMVTQALINKMVLGGNARGNQPNQDKEPNNSENTATQQASAGYKAGHVTGSMVGDVLDALQKKGNR